MARSVFAAAECTVAVLTLVFLFRCRRRFLRRARVRGGRLGGGGHGGLRQDVGANTKGRRQTPSPVSQNKLLRNDPRSTRKPFAQK